MVADIGSGTGAIATELFELSGLENPIWCVDPSVEMQQVAPQKKGVYTVLKTAEEFFSDSQISESFDRVIAVMSAHHFVNPDIVFKGILRSPRPGGIFFLVTTLKTGHPFFKSAEKAVRQSFEQERESHFSILSNLNAKVSQQQFSYPLSLKKSKLYEKLRCRYISMLEHFSDDQIEEGIREFENDVFKDMKDDDLIIYDYSLLVIRAENVD